MRIEPMLAAPMKKGRIDNWGDWAIEEKYDGHRLVIEIDRSSTGIVEISAYTRTTESKKDGLPVTRELPDHLRAELEKLPSGIYDGEIMGGADDAVGTDATRKDLAHKRSFVVFDFLRDIRSSINWMARPYGERRIALELIFNRLKLNPSVLRLAVSKRLRTEEDATRFVKAVWASGGEGAILKRVDSLYYAGCRSGSKKTPCVWIKIKRVSHAILTLVGFEHTKGTVMNRGPFAIMVLRDAEGNETTCKTRDDDMLEEIAMAWHGRRARPLPANAKEAATHPWVGTRRVVIEFPKRTRDGGYQGPVICDRWAEEGE